MSLKHPITRAEIEGLRRLLPEDWTDGVHIETLTDGSEDYCGTAARGPVRYRGPFDRDAEDDRVAALRDLRLLKAIPALLDAADERDRLSELLRTSALVLRHGTATERKEIAARIEAELLAKTDGGGK